MIGPAEPALYYIFFMSNCLIPIKIWPGVQISHLSFLLLIVLLALISSNSVPYWELWYVVRISIQNLINVYKYLIDFIAMMMTSKNKLASLTDILIII